LEQNADSTVTASREPVIALNAKMAVAMYVERIAYLKAGSKNLILKGTTNNLVNAVFCTEDTQK
jgi:hypothetical protein